MDFRDLIVYKKAFDLAMEIFELTKKFPKEETYSLTDQIRRSSRSVCANVGEAYRKRQYQPYFLNRISDADMENTETQVWLDFSESCKYIDSTVKKLLVAQSEEIGKLLNHMLRFPEKYLKTNEK